MPLPTDAKERKRLQLYTFMFKYFPDAWLAVVDVARAGNDQHNPGEPLHWAREKSTDQMNAAFNHIFDYGLGAQKDEDGCWHLAKAIWRLSAQLQLDIEAERSLADESVGDNTLPPPHLYQPGTAVPCACANGFLIHEDWAGWCDGKIVHGRDKCEPGPFVCGAVYRHK